MPIVCETGLLPSLWWNLCCQNQPSQRLALPFPSLCVKGPKVLSRNDPSHDSQIGRLIYWAHTHPQKCTHSFLTGNMVSMESGWRNYIEWGWISNLRAKCTFVLQMLLRADCWFSSYQLSTQCLSTYYLPRLCRWINAIQFNVYYFMSDVFKMHSGFQ